MSTVIPPAGIKIKKEVCNIMLSNPLTQKFKLSVNMPIIHIKIAWVMSQHPVSQAAFVWHAVG